MTEQMQNEDLVKTKTTLGDLTKFLWPYFWKQKTRLVLTAACVLALTITGRLLPQLFGQAIDQGLINKDQSALIRISAYYLLIEIVRLTTTFFQSYLFAKMGNRILYQLRERLVQHTLHLPLSFFDKNPSGRVVTRLTSDIVSLGELFTQGIITLFSSMLSLGVITIAMSLISLKLTLLTVSIAIPVSFYAYRTSQTIREILRDSRKKQAEMNSFLAENLSGMRIVQIYNRRKKNSALFSEKSDAYRLSQFDSLKLNARLWPAVNGFNGVSIAVALYFGGLLTQENHNTLTTGAMVAFILHVRDFIAPLRTILEKYQIFQTSLSGAERMFTLLGENREADIKNRETNEPDSGSAHPFINAQNIHNVSQKSGEIEFRNLKFRYATHLPWTLYDINLQIMPGQSVALLGRTGSGKSSLISLLQGYYDFEEGDILIDHTSIKNFPKDRLRRKIGVVLQDPFLFKGTVAENISLGDPEITQERIAEAARLSCCDRILQNRPQGLDTEVEERGSNFSLGERQLISFARVLAFDPEILILDEATANIDSESERLIQIATEHLTKTRTSIIIAHRLSTIAHVDRVVVLSEGKIIEEGAPHELLKQRGHFYELHQAQAKSLNNEVLPN